MPFPSTKLHETPKGIAKPTGTIFTKLQFGFRLNCVNLERRTQSPQSSSAMLWTEQRSEYRRVRHSDHMLTRFKMFILELLSYS